MEMSKVLDSCNKKIWINDHDNNKSLYAYTAEYYSAMKTIKPPYLLQCKYSIKAVGDRTVYCI